MYWPTATAQRLHLSPCIPTSAPAQADSSSSSSSSSASSSSSSSSHLIALVPSPSHRRFISSDASTIHLWTTRPAHCIAAFVRTQRSLDQYGHNAGVVWRDEGAFAVLTTTSHLLLYTILPLGGPPFSYLPSTGPTSKSKAGEFYAPSLQSLGNNFAAGAGERTNELRDAANTDWACEACEIRFRLVLRVDAGVSSFQSTPTHILLATLHPPSLQCIPWPPDDPSHPPNHDAPRTALLSRLDWIVQSSSVDGPARDAEAGPEETSGRSAAVHVIAQSFSEELATHVWITSDGRAYLTTLTFDTRTAIWRGKCFHGPIRSRRRSAAGRSVASMSEEGGDGSTMDHERDKSAQTDVEQAGGEEGAEEDEPEISPPMGALSRGTAIGINGAFSLIAIGLSGGSVAVYTYHPHSAKARPSHMLSVRTALKSTASYLTTGPVKSLQWTEDGHALAVAWEKGWAVWSTYGKLMACSLTEGWENASRTFTDHFMRGVQSAFWGPGSCDLFMLHVPSDDPTPTSRDGQLFALPFAKSAMAGQHSPDNTRYAFVQLDDALLVYRGSERPDMSIINPESDVWQHVKIPQAYMAANWPIRYACISADGRLIAVSGQRGLAHFSTLSGRWKTYSNKSQERAFAVQGGLQWYQHVLIAAVVTESSTFEIRLYSRDSDLEDARILFKEQLEAPVVLTCLFDNSLLVYTHDNTFFHYLIDTEQDDIRLKLCGSITFDGVVAEPSRVRGMSWMVPPSQQQFGDPMDDLTVATVIFLIDGKLMLLRPRKAGEDQDEVSYDMQILGDRIEYYWTHLSGVGTLENSLWGYDGHGIKLWLDALTIEQAERVDEEEDEDTPEYKTIEESVSMPLDFYPLCVLIEKGIVIGVEPEVSLRRSLDFTIFRSSTTTLLFLQHVLRCYLARDQLLEAVLFASHYRDLVYFAHALEILLHAVLEDEADALLEEAEQRGSSAPSSPTRRRPSIAPANGLPASSSMDSANVADTSSGSAIVHPSGTVNGHDLPNRALLPVVVAFLDHFDEALEVVVGCARKTEVARWSYLFDAVGAPRDLFESCVAAGDLKTAGSYLLVLHNLEALEESTAQAIRLLKLSAEAQNWTLCRDLLRFARSMDESGQTLRQAVNEARLLPELSSLYALPTRSDHDGEVTLFVPQSVGGAGAPAISRGARAESNIPPPLNRVVSAPSLLDEALLEESEGGDSLDGALSLRTPTASARPSLSPTSHLTPQRANSLFGVASEGPPIPQVNVNGRVLPSVQQQQQQIQRSASSSSMSASTSNGSTASASANLAAPHKTHRSGRNATGAGAGLGMSLSRVGLRSTDRLWDPSTNSPVTGRRTSTSTASSASANSSPSRTASTDLPLPSADGQNERQAIAGPE
ncbi:RIC1-domain-containing protein [Ceraceosorus guamensis]|uniref:RIC1-domain-containing protein n=1 Tax=Ceraceosorus guamensis TaxID=1522189 RepID=A0A316VTA2_9BASI|nr:RIC1-domain-containing protein [Ceraceosorus guamensis]PWN40610.1 RIC1-domain-containing protein [Ceraceosorus guamensis]